MKSWKKFIFTVLGFGMIFTACNSTSNGPTAPDTQFNVYTDDGLPEDAEIRQWTYPYNWGSVEEISPGVEGDARVCLRTANNNDASTGWGIYKQSGTWNMSEYTHLRFWIKSDTPYVKFGIDGSGVNNLSSGGVIRYGKYLSSYGWTTSDRGKWKEIIVPLSDFSEIDLNDRNCLFAAEVQLELPSEGYEQICEIDYIRWTN